MFIQNRQSQSRAILAGGIHFGAVVQQIANCFETAFGSGINQWRIAILISLFDVNSAVQEVSDRLYLPGVGCSQEWRRHPGRRSFWIGPQEAPETHPSDVTVPRGAC